MLLTCVVRRVVRRVVLLSPLKTALGAPGVGLFYPYSGGLWEPGFAFDSGLGWNRLCQGVGCAIKAGCRRVDSLDGHSNNF